MKSLVSAILVTGILFSCSQAAFDEAMPCAEELVPDAELFPQTWRLMKMTGSMINSETTGEDMAWQEVIELNADNTFTKTRKRDDKTKDGKGAYSFTHDPVDNSVMLTLSYSSGKDLIGSCVSVTDTETYYFRTKCKLAGTWNACDGPGLEYERQNNND